MSRTPGKRKSESRNSSSVAKSVRFDTHAPASRKATSKSSQQIKNLFDSYANKSMGMIDPDGIVQLCSDLGTGYTDPRILMLAWKLKAQKQGYFTQVSLKAIIFLLTMFKTGLIQFFTDGVYKYEWQQGLEALKADSITKLKKALSDLEREVSKPKNFDEFYTFAFNYSLTEEKQKSIDVDSACELLNVVLKSRYAQVDYITLYLKSQKDYKVINKDQWINFLRFCQEINFPDLANYDSDQAWPLILDNFVDWMKQTQS